ncbi:unnamed protein product, partial [Strongylus vulgaris]
PSLPNLATQTSPAFPVTFDENDAFNTGPSKLPPPPSRLYQNAPVAMTTTNEQDMFTVMWEQIKNVPLSNIAQRSESPQPLIPTRPTQDLSSTAKPSTSSSIPTTTSEQIYAVYPALYEEPPVESIYPNIPSYDTPPVENGRLPSIGKMTAQFDFKPVGPNQIQITAGENLDLIQPVGPNQIQITAGENLDLIQAHDDGGNSEWIWVQRLDGEHGFVPAAYCKAV